MSELVAEIVVFRLEFCEGEGNAGLDAFLERSELGHGVAQMPVLVLQGDIGRGEILGGWSSWSTLSAVG